MIQKSLEVKELSSDGLDDYLAFFDNLYETDPWLNSKDNPWWSGCYCGFFDDTKSEQEQTAQGARERRKLRSDRILAHRATGFLAYLDGKVVGWCNAGPRASYASLQHLSRAVEDPSERVGSILCFVIASPHRKVGVATTLLQSACASFKNSGLWIAEGYPRTKPANVDNPYNIPEAHLNYYGPMNMYLKAGFKMHRQFEKFAAVRKDLR